MITSFPFPKQRNVNTDWNFVDWLYGIIHEKYR
jgi:hypothetical protein